MRNFENIRQELERSGKSAELNALAQSADGEKLSAMLDGEKLQRAAQNGDGEALRSMLGTVLSTEEGRRLAANIKKLMEK
ncbi:MAG: hypothetical protein IJV51_04785 [Oscillospiraceae bacterium]|nr:hypothetical protein [Oscillospiraceae bacterium]